jgi:hypothetical protein
MYFIVLLLSFTYLLPDRRQILECAGNGGALDFLVSRQVANPKRRRASLAGALKRIFHQPAHLKST